MQKEAGETVATRVKRFDSLWIKVTVQDATAVKMPTDLIKERRHSETLEKVLLRDGIFSTFALDSTIPRREQIPG